MAVKGLSGARVAERSLLHLVQLQMFNYPCSMRCDIASPRARKRVPINYFPGTFPATLAASFAIGAAFCLASHLCKLNCCCTPACPSWRGSAENCVLQDSQTPNDAMLLTRFRTRRLRFAIITVSHTAENCATAQSTGRGPVLRCSSQNPEPPRTRSSTKAFRLKSLLCVPSWPWW